MKYQKVNFSKKDKDALTALAGTLVVKGWTIPSGKPTATDYTPFECVNSVSPNSLGTVAASLKLHVDKNKTVSTNKFMADTAVVAKNNKLETLLDFVEHAQAYQIWKLQQADLRKNLKDAIAVEEAEIARLENENKSVEQKKADLAALKAQVADSYV